jgi:phosphotransacetylase
MDYKNIVARITTGLASGAKPCVVVAAPYNAEVLSSLQQALANGFIGDVLLVGDKAQMPPEASSFSVVDIQDGKEIATFAANKAREAQGLLIKGTIASSTILRAALSGAENKRIASHVYVMQSKAFPEQLLLVADAGVNIKPDVDAKAAIIRNTIAVAHKLGIERPKVALVCAVESVNPHIQSTLDAAALVEMANQGAFDTADIAGPMALDAALLPRAAKTKKLSGSVAGQANVLILNDIDAANSTAKGLIGVDGDAMGVVVGGTIPVAFPSRGDSEKTRYDSLLLAAYLAQF